MVNKKGLSDVVTTVLIILLVVAAVSAVWYFIQPTIKGAGKSIEKGQVCITSSIEPITCKNGTTGYTVGYRRITDEKVISVSGVNLVLEIDSGAVKQKTLDATELAALTNGIAASTTIASAVGLNALRVSINAEYTLSDGSKQSCSSVPLACSK